MLVLGIETSCDETGAALVRDGRSILASVVRSQVERHRPFGGVVPEIAAREHVVNLLPVIDTCLERAGTPLDRVEVVAVTERPGLLAALLSGVAAAEALGTALALPVVGVNHIEAHMVAPFLAQGIDPVYPLVSLVVSGGHTHLFHSRGPLEHRLLGATLDDACGEAFDKVARVLELGYPGGPAVEAAAQHGDPGAAPFKRPLLAPDSLDFSFSGLKTGVLHRARGRRAGGKAGAGQQPAARAADLAASFQEAVVDVLVEKTRRAVDRTGVRRVAVGGGVACNARLRERLEQTAAGEGWELLLAPPELCTDNGAMVAARGEELLRARGGSPAPLSVAARAAWLREGRVRGDRAGLAPRGDQ